jgi:hypothetical protein
LGKVNKSAMQSEEIIPTNYPTHPEKRYKNNGFLPILMTTTIFHEEPLNIWEISITSGRSLRNESRLSGTPSESVWEN